VVLKTDVCSVIQMSALDWAFIWQTDFRTTMFHCYSGLRLQLLNKFNRCVVCLLQCDVMLRRALRRTAFRTWCLLAFMLNVPASRLLQTSYTGLVTLITFTYLEHVERVDANTSSMTLRSLVVEWFYADLSLFTYTV